MHPHPASPTTAAPGPVLVYGASGHTGRFVCEELRRRGVPFVLGGRDTQRLSALAGSPGALDARAAPIDDPAALRQAFAGVAAVINCAGPFLDTAEPVCRAALDAGAHYLDVAAEQAAAATLLHGFARQARERHRAVLPASAFYGGLADLLASAAIGSWPSAERVEVAVALDSWHPTRGTRVTGQRNTFARLRIADGALQPVPQPAAQTTWAFAAPFGPQPVVELPFTEMVAMHHHLPVREARSFLMLASLEDVRNPNTPAPVVDAATGRSSQRFQVEVVVQHEGATRRAMAAGQDIYAISAPIIVEAVVRLLDPTQPAHEGGAFTLAQRFDAADFLRALESSGLKVELPAGT